MTPILLLAAFIAVPLVEIGLFIQVGGAIGLWPTLLIVLVTAIAGAALVRAQGMSVVTRAQQRIETGEVPVDEIVHGLMIFAAGLLLLTPGFFTDAIGFALLLPPVRALIATRAGKVLMANIRVVTPDGATRGRGQPGGPIEGDWVEVNDDQPPPRAANGRDGSTPPSPWRGPGS